MTSQTWLILIAVCLAYSFAPGAAALTAMSAGARHGFLRGSFVTLGLNLGILTQLVVVASGLGALACSCGWVLDGIRWVGAGYLVFIGWRQWHASTGIGSRDAGRQVGSSRQQLVMAGWLVNASNPKSTLFLIAVVPPFLDLRGDLAAQYAMLAGTLCLTECLALSGYNALAARVLGLLRSPRQVSIVNRSFGALFAALGMLLPFAQ
jgi:homoserine/homoserine lactone efflux protein